MERGEQLRVGGWVGEMRQWEKWEVFLWVGGLVSEKKHDGRLLCVGGEKRKVCCGQGVVVVWVEFSGRGGWLL